MVITLHEHSITTNISQRYASVEYSYTFENKSLSKFGSNELKFHITIDPGAFISHFVADIDGEIFNGKTKQKEEAKEEYNKAKKKSENAILISKPYKDISNVFQIQTNIDKNSTIKLEITIQQYLTKKFHFNQLNVQILRNFEKYNIYPRFSHIMFTFEIDDASGIFDINIPSSNHTNDVVIDTKKMNHSDTHCSISGKIHSTESSINELMLKYKIKGEQNDSTFIYDDTSHTFCHVISDVISGSTVDESPPNQQNDEGASMNSMVIQPHTLIPRRVMFVIDKSGSMAGGKWNRTIVGTTTALRQLRVAHDRYGMVLFNNALQKQEIVMATETNINQSIHVLQLAYAQGATNINDALLCAIRFIQSDISLCSKDANFYINQIIFLTDGEPNSGVSNTKQIISNVKTANDLSNMDAYCNKISIFSFGVGSDGNDSGWIRDLNHSFLKVLSLNNDGVYKRIKQTNVETALTQYYDMLSKPVVSSICIQYDDPSVTNLTKTSFNTLYEGNDLIVCGQIETEPHTHDGEEKHDDINITATVCAVAGREVKNDKDGKMVTKPVRIRKELNIECTARDIDSHHDHGNMERIWAYLKLQQLAEKELMGGDIEEKMDPNSTATPLSLAMKHQLVTPWTSMIVVKKKREIVEWKDEEFGNVLDGEYDEHKIKLVTIGDSNCGKTSLILRFVENVFGEQHSEVTLGVNCKNKKLKINNQYLNVSLWDTAGAERYSKQMPSMYLRNANGIIFVCDINNIESIRNVRSWAESIQETIDFDINNAILMVNKSDLVEDGNDVQAMSMIEELTNHLGIEYVIASAKENVNVKSSFYQLIGSIYDAIFTADEATTSHPWNEDNAYDGIAFTQAGSISLDHTRSAKSAGACC
eukprot:435412_1